MLWLRVPLVPMALAFAGGIAVQPWLSASVAWPILIAALAWGASLAVLGRPALAAALLIVGVGAAGALRAAPLKTPPNHLAHLALPLTARVAGRLAAEPLRLAPERMRLLIDAERVGGESRTGRIRLTAYGPGLPSLTSGQHVEVEARLHPASGFRNPGGFDYAAHLRREDILVVGSARAERLIAGAPVDPSWPRKIRSTARTAIAGALPPASAALLTGLLLGDRADLPADIDEAFRRAGVYHVLAVSGFNVALVAGSAWALLTLARAGRRAAAVGAIAAVLGFALVVGPEPSVLRAVVMALLVLSALLLEREPSVLNSLALAALLILAARPGDLLEPGFQLSFAATAGIVLAPQPRGVLVGALGMSVAAQLAVLPVTLVHFNQFSLIGPLANLAIVPVAGLATVLGLAGGSIALATETVGALFLQATWPVLLVLRWITTLAAAVPGALVYLPAPPASAVVSYILGLAGARLAWHLRATSPDRPRQVAAGGGLLLGVALSIALWPLIRPPDGRLRITILDVGQGDAIVVETPDGRALLVDAGPGGPLRLDTGERVVAPFLWNHGFLALAAALTTHDDQDHAGGMPAVRRRFAIAEEWTSPGPGGVRWIGGVPLLRMAPAAEPATPRRNDQAVVLRIEHGLASFLLAADVTAAAERELLATTHPLQATVLKVAHHGSRHSSTAEFLAAVRPAFAVISVGPRNGYGHPAPETLARLQDIGARVYRTDRDGAVVFETDGRSLAVTRWATGTTERYCLDPESIC
ncbi:MAG: DNA internalization-related competence protein ComEC/Rec2 [Candidatus Rokuibacteriota bacterium]